MGFKLFVLALLLITINLASCQYFVSRGKLTFTQAIGFCRARRSRLAWIRNGRQLRIARRAVRGNQYFWIGMDDRRKEGRFVWGGRVPASRWNFRRGQPDNAGRGEDCVMIGGGRYGYKFNDLNCNTRLRALCQKVRVRCKKSRTIRKKCHRGLRRVIHIFYARTRTGCRRRKYVKRIRCGGVRHRFCRCSAVGDPHYRTFDGQLIHFYGVCKYTLSKSIGGGKCAFNVEVKNERRGRNRRVSYTRWIEVKMGGVKVRLSQRRRVYVDGKITSVPFKKGNIRVFYSGRLVQFAHTSCGIRAAFDGKSNAYLQVSGRFRGKMIGICGNCNGNRGDDMRTKNGVRVRGRGAYNKIGDSYAVLDDSRGPQRCRRKKKTPLPPTKWCKGAMTRLIGTYRFCGAVRDRKGPFANCFKAARINTAQLYKSCKIDICANTGNRRQQHRSKCQIYKALEERCNEKGITGITWRARLGCPLHCGRNKEYSTNMNPCPKTCENHFLGTKTLCYKLPKREGCQCKPGYLRDGALCVKPKKCKCLELCMDQEGATKCRLWKRQGRCSRYPRIMAGLCKLTCGFCKKAKPKCEDYVSTKRCMAFRRKGKCKYAFFRKICGLTCNLKRCPCGKRKVKKGPCLRNKTRIVTIVSYTRDRRTHTCRQRKRVVRKKCGRCPPQYRVRKTPCNLCKKSRTVIVTRQGRRGLACFRRVTRRNVRCTGCRRNLIRYRKCVGNSVRIFVSKFNVRQGCFRCVRKTKRTQTKVRCGPVKTRRTRCNRFTRRRYIITTKRYPRRCRCAHKVTKKWRICICPKDRVNVYCQRGVKLTVRTTYKMGRKRCKRISRITRRRRRCPPRRFIRGGCGKTCFAVDRNISYRVNRKCKCVPITRRRTRRCCCGKGFKRKYCVRRIGVIVNKTITFKLVYNRRVRRHVCIRRQRVKRKTMRCGKRSRVVRISTCRRPRCRRTVVRLISWRVGCKCHRRTVKTSKICCCPLSRTRNYCSRNRRLMRVRRFYVLLRGVCRVRTVRRTIRVVRCRNIVRKYRCNRKTRQQVTIISLVRPRNCRCRVVRRIRRSKTCTCRPKTARLGPCNRRSCRQTKTVVYYVGPIRGRCLPRRKHRRLRCCCRSPKPRTRCNSRTGYIETIKTRKIFVRKTRTCVTRKTVRRRLRPCPPPYKKIKRCVVVGGVGYRKIVIRTVYRVRSRCSCHTVVKVRRKLCKCPKARRYGPVCRGYTLVYRTVYYKKVGNRCLPVRRHRRVRVPCRGRRRVLKGSCLKNCRRVDTVVFNQRIGCKCIRRRRRFTRVCCCPRGRRRRRCVSNRVWQTTKYYYIRSKRLNRCLPRRRVIRRRVVRCSKPVVVTKSRCRGCTRTVVVARKGVRNCRCVTVSRKIRRPKCCCRRPKTSRACIRNAFVTRTIRYSLVRGRCIRRVTSKSSIFRCRPTRVIKGPRCTKGKRVRLIRTIYYRKVNCKCVRSVKVRPISCICRPPRIRRTPCKRNRRRIVRIRFVRRRGKCTIVRRTLATETCRCSKPRRETRCIGTAYRTVVVSFRRVYVIRKGIRVAKCIPSQRSFVRRVPCRRGRDIIIPCNKRRPFRKYIIKVRHFVRGCRCVTKRSVKKVKACTCEKKNSSSRQCIRNTIVRYTYVRWYARGATCGRRARVTNRRIKCSKRVSSRIIRRCSIRRGFGYYHLYRLTSYVAVNCRCRPRHRRITRLCRCRKGYYKRRCVGGRKVAIIVSYRRRGNTCRKVVRRSSKPTVCRRYVRAARLACNRRTCKRVIRLAFWKRRGCKCVRRVLSKRTICCCPKPMRPRPSKPGRGGYKYRGCVRGYKIYSKVTYVLRNTRRFLVRIGGRAYIRHKVCKPKTTVVKRKVICRPLRNTRRTCNRRTGIGRLYRYVTVRRGCNCVRRRTVKKYRCTKCRPKKTVTRGRCPRRGFFRRVVIKRRILRGLRCIWKTTVIRERCRCKRGSNVKRCDGRGNIVRTTVIIKLRGRRCVKYIRRRSTPVRCRGTTRKERVVVGRCNKSVNRKKIYYIRIILKPLTCKCSKKVRVRSVPCVCPKPKEQTRCFGRNRLTKRYIVYVKRNFRCVRRTRIRRRIIRCRKSVKDKFGKCNPRTKKIRVTQVKFVLRNCRCVPLVRTKVTPCKCVPETSTKTVKCKNNVIETTAYIGKRVGLRCVEIPRVTRKVVRCRRRVSKILSRCNRKTCKMVQTTRVWKAVGCKCRWVVARRKPLTCCCPLPKKPRVYCRGNNLIVRRVVSYRYVRYRCIRQVSVRRKRVVCNRRIVRRRKVCPTCNGKLLYYSYRPVKCKCRLRVVRRKPHKCCCPRKRKSANCIASTGVKVYLTVVYIKARGRCFRRVYRRTSRTICRGRKLRGRCNGRKKVRFVRMFARKRRACSCYWKLMFRRREPCICPKRIIRRVTKCVRSYRLITLYRKILRRRRGRNVCVTIRLRRFRERCKCPKPMKKVRCTGHYRKVTVVVTYRLTKKVPKRCVKKVRKTEKPMGGCNRRPKTVNVKYGRCNKRTRLRKIIITKKVARNCKCRRFKITRRVVCTCPKPRSSKRCGKKGTVRVTIRVFYITVRRGKGKVICVKKVTRRTRPVPCKVGKKVVEGRCYRPGRGLRRRVVYTYSIFRRRCACYKRLTRKQIAPCTCPRPKSSSKCVGNYRVVSVVIYRLKRYRCVRRVIVERRKIRCKVGTRVTRTKCSRNTYLVTKKTSRIRRCKCTTTTRRHRCHCRCPKKRTVRRCSGRFYFINTTYYYVKRACKCRKRASRRRTVPPCVGRPGVRATSCKRTRSGKTGYKTITVIKRNVNRRRCTCGVTVKRKRKVCYCKPEKLTSRVCVRRKYIKETSSRRFLSRRLNRCIRKVYRRRTIVVRCRGGRRRTFCDKKGVLKLHVVRSYARNCKCRRVTRVTRLGRCVCDPKPKKIGDSCNRRNCVRVRIYVKQRLVGRKCRGIRYSRRTKCCCPPPKTRKWCDVRRGLRRSRTLTYRLFRGRCVARYRSTAKGVKCSRRRKKIPLRCIGSYKRVRYLVFTRRGCTCRWVTYKIRRIRCRCRKPISRQYCRRAARKIVLIKIWWVLNRKRGICIKRSRKTTRRVPCRRTPVKRLTRCNRATGKQYLVVTRFYISRKCRCTPRTKRYPRDCVCHRKRKLTRKCNSRTGVVTTTLSVRILNRRLGKCVKIVEKKKRRVSCRPSTYRLVRRRTRCMPVKPYGIRVRIYKRRIRRGCRCVTQRKNVKCHCRCRGPSKRTRCTRRGRVLIVDRFTYRFDGCRCKRRRRRSAKRIYCRKPFRRQVSKCSRSRRCTQLVTTTRRRVRGCRCVNSVRRVRRTCCCPKDSSKTVCRRARGIIVTRRVSYRFVPYRCIRTVKLRRTKMRCNGRPKYRNPSRCRNRKFVVTVIRSVRRGCSCVPIRRRVVKKCPCAPPRTVPRKCNRKTCKRTYLKIYFILKKFRCVRYVKKFKRRCCCPRNLRVRVRCRGNRKIRKVTWTVFNRRTRTCVKKFNIIDITPKCGKRYTRKHKCNKRSGILTIVKTWRYRHRCACRRRVKTTKLRCTCPRGKISRGCYKGRFKWVKREWSVLIRGRCYRRKKKTFKTKVCGPIKRRTGRCNRFSCKQVITTFIPYVRNCKCRIRVTRSRPRDCCCRPRRPSLVRKCIKNKINIIRKWSVWLPRRRVCVRRTRRKIRSPNCRVGKRVYVGRCRLRVSRRRGRFQSIKIVTRYVVNCRCARRVNRKLRRCYCGRPKKTKKCVSGNMVTYTTTFRLTRRRTCIAVTRRTRVRMVRCGRRRPRYTKLPCRGRYRIVLRIVVVKRGCKCIKRVRRIRVTCTCPRRPLVRRRCWRNRIIQSVTTFRLTCSSVLRCRCRKIVRTTRRLVSCSRPKYSVTRCKRGFQYFHATVFFLRRCRCFGRRRSRRVRCKLCVDLLSKRDCRKEERTGQCDASPAIRNKLCKKTCGTCLPCKHGVVKYVKIPGRGLKTDKRYKKRFLLRKVIVRNVRRCKRICKRMKRCASFETIRRGRRTVVCVFSTVNTTTIKRRVRRYRGNRSPRRTLYRKICAKKCPRPNTKKLSKCRCDGKKVKICYQVFRTTYYTRDSRQRCRRVQRVHKSPCKRPCVNIWPPNTCRKLKRRGRCGNKKVRRNCNKSCMKGCPCNKRIVFKGLCRRNRGSYRQRIVVYKLRKIRGICTVNIRRYYKSCPVTPCRPRTTQKVTPCIGGKRSVYTIRIRRDLSVPGKVRCTRKVTKRRLSCRGCCPAIKINVTKCRRGKRVVTVSYWARIRNCCRKRSIRKRLACSRCPRDNVSYGRCRFGVSIRYMQWYHRRFGARRCVRHVKVNLKRCWRGRKTIPKRRVPKPTPKKPTPKKPTPEKPTPEKPTPEKPTPGKPEKKPYYEDAMKAMAKAFG